MPPKRKCPVCGSRKWHKEPLSGLITCTEGHVLQNYRNEMNDSEPSQHAMKKRRLKSGRQKKEKTSKANPQFYHGARARFHYFQCLQLILRKQISALRRLWNLPEIYEVICRDLWALHLSQLDEPIPAEPYLHHLDSQDDPSQENKHRSSDDSSSNSSEDSLDELLRQNSELSSDEDEEGGNQPQQTSKAKRKPKGKPASERPISTIAILVLACWTLRIPALYRDFIRAIEAYDLPYLDSTRYLPTEMSLHLYTSNVQALSPRHAPRVLELHSLVSKFGRQLHAKFNILTPPANAAPIMWRTVRAMCGTPALYTLTKRLAGMLEIPLTLVHMPAPQVQSSGGSQQYHMYDNMPIELSFAVVVVMVLKMMYGMDGRPRLPRVETDPVCSMPSLKNYLDLLVEQVPDQTEMFSSEVAMPVADLDDQVLDDYLDFCETALVNEDPRLAGQDLLHEFFPLCGVSARRREKEPQVKQIRVHATEASAEENGDDVLRPGEEYKIYRARDVGGDVHEDMELVISKAAEWAKVETEDVYRVLEMYEWRVERGKERAPCG